MLEHRVESFPFRLENNSIVVDGTAIDPAAITATRVGEDTVHRAADISRMAPVSFSRGDVVTFHISGYRLTPGKHHFEVEIFELNLGSVQLALKDNVGPAPV